MKHQYISKNFNEGKNMGRLLKQPGNKADSVKARKEAIGEKKHDMALLMKCQQLWDNLSYFRQRRERAIMFTYGDQWGDMIDVDGKRMTQRAYVTSKGNVAFQVNLIRKMVNTISGVWVKEQNEPVAHARDRAEQQYGEVMTTALQTNWQKNYMSILLVNCIEDALLGGACFIRESYSRRDGDEDSWSYVCNPNYMFFDSTMKDPRFWDMSLIGEIHDITFTEFCRKFCKSLEDYDKAKDWYTVESHPFQLSESIDMTDKNNADIVDFYSSSDKSLCRVYEIWTKESRPRYRVHDPNTGELYIIDASDHKALSRIERLNKERLEEGTAIGWAKDEIPLIKKQYFIDTYWYYRFLTPGGYIISEGESLFADRRHPYTICAMPFTDGKIVSYISDAIDQNMAINRFLTLDDWIRRSGAKGVTFVPRNIVPKDMSYDEFAAQWTSIDGIIFYEPKAGVEAPRQFYGNIGQLDTANMVKLLNDLMESSIAVSGALQGKTPYSGTSAALYAQQTQNSSTPIATFMKRFGMFVEQVAIKKLKYITQFYTLSKYKEIAGKMADMDLNSLDLNRTGDLEYDLAVRQSTETPVYRMIANDILLEFWRAGAIQLEDALSLSSLPFSDALLQRLQARKKELQEASSQSSEVPAGDNARQ